MERIEGTIVSARVPGMFNAGISNKFTKKHVDNFRDTTLTAASAAKTRAEKKLERQADAIEKQQQKIEAEMRKVEELAQRLHRQQVREAKRLRGRLEFAASVIQRAYRSHAMFVLQKKNVAATNIQRAWRGAITRKYYLEVRLELIAEAEEAAAGVITRCTRQFVSRRARKREHTSRQRAATAIQCGLRRSIAQRQIEILRKERELQLCREHAAIVIQATARSFVTRLIYMDVLFLICRIQAVARGYFARQRFRRRRRFTLIKPAIIALQAHVRGFYARQRYMQKKQDNATLVPSSTNSTTMCRRTSKLRKFDADGSTQAQTKTTALSRTHVEVETIIKRSYWLPAGASFNKRLPIMLPPTSTTPPVTSEQRDTTKTNMNLCFGNDEPELVRCFTKQPPRRRPHTRPRPGRLSPVLTDGKPSISCAQGSVDKGCLNAAPTETSLTREGAILQQQRLEEEGERRKEREARERQARRDKQRAQQEDLARREAEERVERERAAMEREDRAMRLYVKLLQRRSKEGRVKRQSAEQQREERERIVMAREERHTRLCLKRRRTAPRASSSQETTTVKGSDNADAHEQPSIHEKKSRERSQRRRGMSLSNLPATHKKRPDNQSTLLTGLTWQERVKAKMAAPASENEVDECGVDYGDEFEDMVDERHLAVH